MTVDELRELLDGPGMDGELTVTLRTGRPGTICGSSEWGLAAVEARDTDVLLDGET